jgi:F-box-like
MLGRLISIDMLPDDVLLEIFDFYVGEDLLTQKGILVDLWRKLVHVCRRWRSLVFGSPRRLKLRLVCIHRTPTRKSLDVWPKLPLIIDGHASTFVVDNLIAALERRDRVCRIDLRYYTSPESEKFWAAMQEPFPELTHLWLEARGEPRFGDEESEWFERPGTQDVFDSFLGGSAPHLQFLWMNAVRLQGLQKLLLSATHLIDLCLIDIPDYISSQRMATCLSVLTSLQTLSLAFEHHLYPPYQESRHPSPPKRIILPALRYFQFTGISKYLENLVAQIDAPELSKLSITFNQRVSNTPELAQFVSRMPKLGVPYEARMDFHDLRVAIRVRLPSQIFGHELLDMGISSGDFRDPPVIGELDSQLSSLAQVCASLLPTVCTVENLYIYEDSSSALSWSDEDMESTRWLELLRSFIALKNLYLFKEFVPRIASALEDLEEGSITELLPSLQNIFVQGLQPSGHIQEGIRQFIAARRHIGHPITVSTWDVKYDETWS